MLLYYKDFTDVRVKYDLELILKESIYFLWFSNETKKFKKWVDIFGTSILINVIFVAIWLKYWNNSQVMEDFWKIVDNRENDNEYATLVTFCNKYGRTISIKHIITAHNLCAMFTFQNTKNHSYYNILKHAKLGKNFVDNAAIDVKNLTFDDFIIKNNMENKPLPSNYEFYDKKIDIFLEEALTNVKKLSFTNCDPFNVTMPYFNGECVNKIAKIVLTKPLGLQILYVSIIIGNVLTHYFNEYKQNSGDTNAENLVETYYKQFVNNIENILNKMVENNSDFTIINNYLELVNNRTNDALRQIFDFSEDVLTPILNLKTPYNDYFTNLRDQKDGTAPITRTHKLCQLLDTNVANQLVSTPLDMWSTVLDARIDIFDETMDDFYNAIINCGIIINRDSSRMKYLISFDKYISPEYFQIRKFRDIAGSPIWGYYIPLQLNFYEYFDTIGSTETDNMLILRKKCVKELEICLTNMQKLFDEGKLKEHIEVIYL